MSGAGGGLVQGPLIEAKLQFRLQPGGRKAGSSCFMLCPKCDAPAFIRRSERMPELFEDWSNRFPSTDENPDAAAEAYLQHERGLDLRFLRGTFSQELFRDRDTGQTSATIRFPIGDSYWERIIDKPGRFAKKAHFKYGGKWSGHCWMPKGTTLETLGARVLYDRLDLDRWADALAGQPLDDEERRDEAADSLERIRNRLGGK